MSNAVYAGLLGYTLQSISFAFLTVKWYVPIVMAFFFAPIHFWILTEFGISGTLTLNFFNTIFWVMFAILVAGLVAYVAMGYGFDCEAILPLFGFRDEFKSPTIMIAQIVAFVLDGIWLTLYYKERSTNYNWAILGAWALKNIIIIFQFIVTKYSAMHQVNYGILKERTPFASVNNVNAIFLLYAILINIPFMSLLIVINVFQTSIWIEMWGVFVGLGIDMFIVIIWVIKLNMNSTKKI